jgi:hypothetical protein
MEQRKGTSMECPFCGHHGDLVSPESFSDQRGETLWCIHCKHCLADGPVEMSLDSAVREWKLRYVPWERDLKRALELAEQYIVGTINGHTFSTDSEDLAWVIAKLNEAEESSPSNPSHHDGAAPAPSVDGVVGSLNKEG